MNVNNDIVYKIMHGIFYIVYLWYFNIAKILRKAVWNGHHFCSLFDDTSALEIIVHL